MRKWIGLAAAATLLAAAPAMARNIPSTDDISADEKAVVARLQAAAAKMDNNDNKGAEADLGALAADPGFAHASALTRAETLTLLGICESIDHKPEAAFKHLSDAATTDPDVRDRLYWIELAYVADDLKKDDLLGEALTQAVLADPDSANTISPGFVFDVLRRQRALKDGGVHNRQLLEALVQVRYGPQSDPTAGESLRRFLFEVYADAGQDAKAQALVSGFTAPETVIALRADNRYRKYLLADADLSDFPALQDRYIAALRTRQGSGGLPVAQELAMTLTSANRLPEALKVVDDALALGDLAANAKTDEGDEAKWLLDTRTRILVLMGRWDEVEAAQVKARDTALKEGVDLVSQKINLADLYNRLGRPQDALKELNDLHNDSASVYGQMVAEQVRACAYATLGDKDKLKASLDIIRSHASEARNLLASSLTCAGDEDAVAALTIARLDDPDQRNDELVNDQDYLPAPHPTPYDKAYADHLANVFKRPDVKAAIAKYGVIESYPDFAPEN